MFYEFAAHKATAITQLQRLILASEVDDDDSNDVELSSMLNESSIDANGRIEFYLQTFLSKNQRPCATYICGHLFRIHAHAELFDLFHLFTLFLEEFDYCFVFAPV